MKRILAAVLLGSMLTGMIPLAATAEEQTVNQIMQQMSLRDKITQMLMVDFCNWDENPEDDVQMAPFTTMNDQVRQILEQYRFGAVIYFAQNLTSTDQAYRLVQGMQQATVDGGGVPMLICTDQEGGSVYRLGTGTALPGNMALGATGDAYYSYLAGRIMGSELSALGINTNLAPVVDVNNNASNPVIGIRAYSDDPQVVGQMASSAISGMAEFGVVACAKHFPGHGDTATDSHYGLPRVDKSLEQLRGCELLPYEIAIDQGAQMIMTAHILYPQLEDGEEFSLKTGKAEDLPASMSPKIITKLLKEDMGFSGIVVSDAMNMAGIRDYWDPVQAVVLAFRAGVDMVCMPCTLQKEEDVRQLEAVVQGVEAAVADGTIPLARIDDAVKRILTVKETRGILVWKEGNNTLDAALEAVGSDANRELERCIAAAAVTVVENKNRTLPLRLTPDSRVLMLVPYNNERAQMLLGWNRAVQAGLIPEGAQVQVVRFHKDAGLDTFRQQIDWADTLIFNSEISQTSRLSGGRWESAYILNVLKYAKAQGKTTVVQSVDKPYDVQSYPDADAVIAVYGCKGATLDPTQVLTGGVTVSEDAFGPNIVAGIEVMFGVFAAEGTLPVDIPVYANGAFSSQIAYPRGYGLHYESLISPPQIPKPQETAQETTAPTVVSTAAVQTETETIRETAHTPIQPEPGKSRLWIPAAMAALGLLLLCKPKAKKKRKRK